MSRPRLRPLSTLTVPLLLALALALATGAGAPTPRAEAATTGCTAMPTVPLPRTGTPAPTGQAPYFGVLGSTLADPAALKAAGVTTVTLAVAWDRLEPQRGCVGTSYLAELRTRYAQYRALGLDVVLDAGLQYVPAWVFALPGETRFVNQHGDVYRGSIGADVPDAVFNPAVRQAQGAYLAGLGAVLRDLDFRAVRVGGLANNELMYPTKNYNGHTDSFWSFSARARALSPVPTYRPGTGTPQQAKAFLDFYLRSLNDYAAWQVDRYRHAFGLTPTVQLLLPSWGVRPGNRTAAENGLLTGRTQGELTGTLNQGLDWDTLARRAVAFPGRTELYSTWMDAPDQGTSLTHMSPMRYIVTLARQMGLPAAGENTGRNQVGDMQRSRERVSSLGLTGMFWMNESQLRSGSYATLADYAGLIAARPSPSLGP